MISTEAMDRIIDITEKNLQMQGEFLRNLMELRGRFDNTDRDHKDFEQYVKQAVDNTTDMMGCMRAASNEKIIELIEKDREKTTDLQSEFSTMCLKIATIADNLSDSDRWSKRFISVVTVVIILVQSLGIYMIKSRTNETAELNKRMIEVIKTISSGKD